MERAAKIASGMTGKDFEAEDMYAALVALKLSRHSYNYREDNLLDCVAYLGGLDNFKDWLKLRENAFSQEAIKYGLPYPKGLLLVGVQGTGKSIAFIIQSSTILVNISFSWICMSKTNSSCTCKSNLDLRFKLRILL